MNTVDILDLARVGVAPGYAPLRGALRFRSGRERICSHVARVSCPDEGRVRSEPFALPSSRFEERPKVLTSKEVSYI
ncbi:MAG: hypothetical protein WA734_07475, partial [Candidatus Acidiferrales bacterium]